MTGLFLLLGIALLPLLVVCVVRVIEKDGVTE